jgi:glycosyltransferase involved in cell wall biosynthesis
MSKQGRVSVIIPTLNRADLISRAIRSVQASDYADIELMVVDQESEDHTPSVLSELGVKWVTDPVRGAGHARKYGLEHTTGNLVLFLDSDDWLTPWGLGVLVQSIETQGTDGAYGMIQPFNLAQDDGGQGVPPVLAPLTSCSLVRRDVFKTFGELDNGNFSWPQWVIGARRAGITLSSVSEVVAYRGIHADNLSKQAGSTGELFALVRHDRDARGDR